jgi:hypothetical protein
MIMRRQGPRQKDDAGPGSVGLLLSVPFLRLLFPTVAAAQAAREHAGAPAQAAEAD